MAKPRKVEEPAGAYSAKKPSPKVPAAAAQPVTRFVKQGEVEKTNARLMQVHRKVLQKLAQ